MSVEYEQGMTKVWTDGEKLVVTNRAGKTHVKANVEQIFGMGEWDKIYKHKYLEESKQNPGGNPYSKTYTCISPYIPQRAEEDLELEMNSDENIMGKYFET